DLFKRRYLYLSAHITVTTHLSLSASLPLTTSSFSALPYRFSFLRPLLLHFQSTALDLMPCHGTISSDLLQSPRSSNSMHPAQSSRGELSELLISSKSLSATHCNSSNNARLLYSFVYGKWI